MIRPKPQDLQALIIDHLRTTMGLMNIPSLIEPIRDSEVTCLLDAGAGVDLHVFHIPCGPRHCPGTAVPVVLVVVLQSTQAVAKMIVLGSKVLGSGNSLRNHCISSEADTPPSYVALLEMGLQPILRYLHLRSRHSKRKGLILFDLYSSLGN
jgi:hypothetical protein